MWRWSCFLNWLSVVSVNLFCCFGHTKNATESGTNFYSLNFYPMDSILLCFILSWVHGYYSFLKSINSRVPKGSVPSYIFLLFIYDLSKTKCLFHSYSGDTNMISLFFQEVIHPTGTVQVKSWGCKTLNHWPYYHFWTRRKGTWYPLMPLRHNLATC